MPHSLLFLTLSNSLSMLSRSDPLALLKLNPALAQAPNQQELVAPQELTESSEEKTRITIQIPLPMSKEIKKIAVDHEITRDQLIYSMLRQVHANPELMKEAVNLAKKISRKHP